MLFSDAPYGIRIKGNVSQKHEDFAMGVGEQSSEEFTAFLKTMIELSLHTWWMEDLHIYLWTGDTFWNCSLPPGTRAYQFSIFVYGIKQVEGMGGLYRSQHEPIFVFKHGKAPHTNNVALGKYGRNRTNVWSAPRPRPPLEKAGTKRFLCIPRLNLSICLRKRSRTAPNAVRSYWTRFWVAGV